MKDKYIKNGVLNLLLQKYLPLKGSIEENLKITGIDSDYYEFASELLGMLLEKFVWLSIDEDQEIKKDTIIFREKDTFDINSLISIGYQRVERVWNEGEISVLGDVVLIWPFSMNRLVRLSLFDDQIEKISVVDIDSRKKIKDVKERIFLSSNTKFLVGNEEASESINISMEVGIGDESNLVNLGLRRIPGAENYISRRGVLEIIKNFQNRNYEIWYLTNNLDKYETNTEEELRDCISKIFVAKGVVEKSIKRGLVSSVAKVLLLTDLEVLGELDLSMYEKKNIKIDPGSVEILKKIVPGDYIVHQDHGIGRFSNLIKKEHGLYVEISYAGKDKLFVPLSASEKLTKYIGAGKNKPILTGLNSGVWKRISSKAKERVEDIARELLQLYALRKTSKTEIIIDTDLSLEELNTFIKQFEFDDTDDQLLATEHIVKDFKNSKPMDRLLVGDVGYGKTEVAARAIFSVINAGYQVALLAPTTILVEQHVSVLKERFKNYPFNIDSLSRFSSSADRERVLNGLKNGNIDLVIGTHSLLSKEISFKSLRLLVIDEEQKFGVKQKEEIKSKRVDTNVLSLTATPIPRTLNMALMGIRDISVLATPPLGRKEIVNYFEEFNWESVNTAISTELKRKGQVYFLHNRVNTIEQIYDRLVKMFPQVSVGIAHGQMSVHKLSESMKDFVSGKTDILVCTTIIENGLDIPSVNTLILDDASMLGLSQMYQIRGRIGRSNRQGYAYFFYHNLKGDAQLRLEAIKESQELGSGFLLSNKDLEIRGAGDILGKNQSGTINSVGYGLYSQMLEEAVKNLVHMGK